jgi:hypothetical protein
MLPEKARILGMGCPRLKRTIVPAHDHPCRGPDLPVKAFLDEATHVGVASRSQNRHNPVHSINEREYATDPGGGARCQVK